MNEIYMVSLLCIDNLQTYNYNIAGAIQNQLYTYNVEF